MAKTAKPKYDPTANPRSRASKRATSPSINTDKSLKEIPRPSAQIPMTSARASAGIVKVRKKLKPLKRGQIARKERGQARAEAIQDQMAKKVDGAELKLKKRRERKAVWDEVNDASKEAQRKAPKLQMLGNGDKVDGDEWENETADDFEDADMKEVDSVTAPVTAVETKLVVLERPTSTTVSEVEDEADKIT